MVGMVKQISKKKDCRNGEKTQMRNAKKFIQRIFILRVHLVTLDITSFLILIHKTFPEK